MPALPTFRLAACGTGRSWPARPVKLGAQNMYFEEKGAYTGEISPTMLRELCEYVILGIRSGVLTLAKPMSW